MTRSLPLLAMILLFFLALVPAPLVSGGLPIGAIGKIGSYSFRLSPQQVTKALGKHAGDILDVSKEIYFLPPVGDNEKGADAVHKAPERAANTAGLYIFNLSVGTPVPQNVAGVLDITISFVWAQCEPCTSCLQAAPSFRSKASPTFATVPCASPTCQQSVLKQECPNRNDGSGGCGYTVDYGVRTNTTGYLANDTFTFGDVRVPDVVFGCSYASSGDFSGASGSFGFGRGPLSLVSQLKLSWFSYLLASDGSGIGGAGNLLQFGDDDVVPRSSRGRLTPLVHNSIHPDRYYVKLKGIQVDDGDLTGIPAGTFDFQNDGSGGVFLSTTTPVTYLEEAAYKVVRQAFVSRIASVPMVPVDDQSALGLDRLCYRMPTTDKQVPKLTLVFDDDGATSTGTVRMQLEKNNYFLADSEIGLECLMIMPSRGGSVLGSLMQTDTNMTFDIRGEQLVFETPPRRSKVFETPPRRSKVFETSFAPPPPNAKVSVYLRVLAPSVALVLVLGLISVVRHRQQVCCWGPHSQKV